MSQKLNDLTSLVEGTFNAPGMYGRSETISQPYTFGEGIQYTPFSLNRVALNYGYMGYGLVQTLVDLPVEDAFRGGYDIITSELDTEDIKLLKRFMLENGDDEAVKSGMKWARLFGGAALLIETDENNTTKPFNPAKLTADSVLRFIPADRWELVLTGSSILDISRTGFRHTSEQQDDIPYIYYTVPLHRSRVMRLMGREAPSYIRVRLQGWGMSELERCMRSINSFVKFQNVIFELIDEAKIDVFKIQQFNENLATAEGTELIQKRIQLNAILKNYKNSTVMDAEDDFTQKQITWSGLAEIYQELRQNLSSDLQIPEAKLFGQSSSGFSSGQDTIENYNSLVESGVRTVVRPHLHRVIGLRCQQLFGFEPAFEVKFKTLRIMTEPEEEQVLTSKTNRRLSLFDRQLLTGQETMLSLDKDGLVNIESEVQQGLREVEFAEPESKEGKENAMIKQAEKLNDSIKRRDQAIMAKLKRA